MTPSNLTRPRAVLRALGAAVVVLASGFSAAPAHASAPDDRIEDAAFVVTVTKDGGVHVDATFDLRFAEPSDLPHLWWEVPTWQPWTAGQDDYDDSLATAQTLSNVTGTIRLAGSRAGTAATKVPVDVDSLNGSDFLDLAWPDFLDDPVDSATFTLSYDVAGAVLPPQDGGSGAELALPLVEAYSSRTPEQTTVRVTGPDGPVTGLTCAGSTGLTSQDDGVTCDGDGDGGVSAHGGDDGLTVRAGDVPGAAAQQPVLMSRYDDTIDSFAADYTVLADGTLDVTETIAYRFGRYSDQHGIIRSLVAREPWSTWKDRTYGIDVVGVTSPSGADATLHEVVTGSERLRTTDLRVGSEDHAVRTPTATYVLHYRVDGALLRRDGRDELSWDVTGTMSRTLYKSVDVTVHLPGSATSARCWAGAPGSTDPCAKADTAGDVATFRAEKLDGGEGMTIDVTMAAGSVTATGPDLAPRALPVALQWYLRLLLGLGALSLVVSVVVASVWRLTHRDEREGTTGSSTTPRSTPPDLPMPLAGAIVDGTLTGRETSAVLLSLAAAGVIAFVPVGDGFGLRLEKPGGGRDDLERAVAGAIHQHVAQEQDDDDPEPPVLTGTTLRAALHAADRRLRTAVRASLDERQKSPTTALFRRRVRLRYTDPARWWLTLLALPVPGLFPVAVTLRFVHGLRPCDRTALGRRYVDETRAFRRFLADLGANRAPGRTATAPAGAVAHVGGIPGMLPPAGSRAPKTSSGFGTTGDLDPLATRDDLFGTLLPWAITLGVADDWAERLAPLVRDGLVDVPESLPWNTRSLDIWSGLWLLRTTAAAATWTPSSGSSGSGSSGTGYSGGSSYSGGGGFSGGGGGGGGTSSW